ncbi:hypothetical protein B0H19DRAFT_306044 [Mycena capillaripes]|nr:hypothetical protein B0H19DRAFT_306044 [Mycena capillaripes]
MGAHNTTYQSKKIEFYDGFLFDIIRLARENGLFTVLPCAYMRAIFYNHPNRILDGISHTDGRPPVTFSFEDQRVCILGNRKLLEAQWKQQSTWEWLSSENCAEGCTDNVSCAAKKQKVFRTLVSMGAPLVPFRLAARQGLCSACERHHKMVMAEGRKKLWDDLPTFFDLPPWGELKNEIDV